MILAALNSVLQSNEKSQKHNLIFSAITSKPNVVAEWLSLLPDFVSLYQTGPILVKESGPKIWSVKSEICKIGVC
jgi:hypothetical protein